MTKSFLIEFYQKIEKVCQYGRPYKAECGIFLRNFGKKIPSAKVKKNRNFFSGIFLRNFAEILSKNSIHKNNEKAENFKAEFFCGIETLEFRQIR